MPIIQQHPNSLSVSEGQKTLLVCSFIGVPHPASTIKWVKDNRPLPEKLVPVQGLRNSSLVIPTAQLNDAGDYACIIETSGQKPVRSRRATVQVRGLFAAIIILRHMNCTRGSQLMIRVYEDLNLGI